MKGVNKLVMEVRPESEYFDKAILFLRSDIADKHQKEISKGAENLLKDISESDFNNKSNKPSPVILLFAGITAGSLISWTVFILTGLI